MSLKLTQTRKLNWETEPFVFYAVRTVRLCCGRCACSCDDDMSVTCRSMNGTGAALEDGAVCVLCSAHGKTVLRSLCMFINYLSMTKEIINLKRTLDGAVVRLRTERANCTFSQNLSTYYFPSTHTHIHTQHTHVHTTHTYAHKCL